jgi:hypothetical protein
VRTEEGVLTSAEEMVLVLTSAAFYKVTDSSNKSPRASMHGAPALTLEYLRGVPAIIVVSVLFHR